MSLSVEVTEGNSARIVSFCQFHWIHRLKSTIIISPTQLCLDQPSSDPSAYNCQLRRKFGKLSSAQMVTIFQLHKLNGRDVIWIRRCGDGKAEEL
jgi:hypothetical protein